MKSRRHAIPRIPPRALDAHKGDFGKVLIVAGSPAMTGAAFLCGEAALRSGSGLVTIAVPRSIHAIVASKVAGETTLPLPCSRTSGAIVAWATPVVLESLRDKDALAVGPGLGQDRGTREFLFRLLQTCEVPVVIDADGLNLLAGRLDFIASAGARTRTEKILTPHPGEMARLLGIPTRDVEADREGAARRAAKAAAAVVILKGHRSVITDGDRLAFNETGNPGMATGGSGDVLTGIAASLLGQRFPAFEAARLAAHVHGLAGDLARDEKGEVSMIAADLLDTLPAAFRTVSGPRRGAAAKRAPRQA